MTNLSDIALIYEKKFTCEALFECAIGDVLADQNLLTLIEAEADEADDVLVVNPGQELDFTSEFQAPLQGALLGFLHSNQLPTRKCPSVNLQL